MPQKFPNFAKTILILLVLLTASYYLANRQSKAPQQYFIGAQNTAKAKEVKLPQTYEITNPELTNFPGRWAIAIKDLKKKETYLFNADQKFPSASIYKLAIMWATFDALEKSQLQREEVLSQDKITLDKKLAGQESTTTQESQEIETVSYSVENALSAMITISHNYSAILLAEKLGWTNITTLMEKEGLEGFDLVSPDSPTTTASSTANLLERIWQNTAVSFKSSQEMKSLLFAQQVNDRIPKYLPEGTKVAHKTGELDALRHDAGIIIGKKSDYIFVFLTETPIPEEATENIAQVSKKIYDALEQ